MEDKYQKVHDREHVLLRPDTYVGSMQPDTREMWIYDEDSAKILFEKVTFVPGFLKIFDEILVNARDRSVEDSTCKNIKVEINKENNSISVFNDGLGVPIIPIDVELEKNKPKVKMYIPEMVFGELRAGSNFNDDTRTEIVGGRNGYGAKLTNIFSKEFIVETTYINKKDKIFKKFVQKFRNNMSVKDTPIITNVKENTTSGTKITFVPDLEKFKMTELTEDVIKLLHKRVYDIAACTDKNFKVFLDGKQIGINNFSDFIKLHYQTELTSVPTKVPKEGLKTPVLVYEEVNDRWKIGVVYDPDNGGNHISFVNGIWTYNGGSHVKYIVDQVLDKLEDEIKKKIKKISFKKSQIKEHLTVFIDAAINKPGFSSQSKEELNTKVSDFGSTCVLDTAFIGKIKKSGIVQLVTDLATAKAMTVSSKTDGKKVASVRNIPKLDDAHWAGTRKSKETRLILTEGDSAKAFATTGVQVIGRDRYGIFPLKGKLLNVRNKTGAQAEKNDEFTNLKKIIGLKHGVKYSDVSKLRYGGILILTDQDDDGSHIKGLIINMFEYYWPELLLIDGFIQTLKTPLLKIWKKNDKEKKNPKIFYTISEYENWVHEIIKSGEVKKWDKPKYYKGLGTSSEKEAREIFNDFHSRIISYIWEKCDENDNPIICNTKIKNTNIDENDNNDNNDDNGNNGDNGDNDNNGNNGDNDNNDDNGDNDNNGNNDDNDDNGNNKVKDNKKLLKLSKSHIAIDTSFNANCPDKRKNWLNTKYNKNNVLEYNSQQIPYSMFIDYDLIHFSHYDNIRSIPSMIDGLKPSQRKILYAGFKKKMYKSEVKVAQFGSYVAEHTAYKHGEKSIEEAIIGMAQRFPGSNNIYLFHPCGNFGFRRLGGDDHASSRYIFTHIDSITRKIFVEEDECVLNFQEDEGMMIEPDVYCPIIPMVLVNGTKGVGTGWSTEVHPYNPIDIINNLLKKIDGKQMKEMHPWFHGFNGKIEKTDKGGYKVYGNFETINYNTLKITDIPIKGNYWKTDDYKEYINSLENINGKEDTKIKKIASIKSDCGNNEILFTLEFVGQELQNLIKNCDNESDEIIKYLKLSANISCNNMHLFNADGVITHYKSVLDIIDDFYDYRLAMYVKRKKHHLKHLNNELEILKYKIKFLKDVMSDKIIIKNKKMADVINDLKKKAYPKLSPRLDALDPIDDDKNIKNDNDDHDEEHDEEESKKNIVVYKSYKYLTDIRMFSQTTEEIDKLNNKDEEKKKEYDIYNSTTEVQLWKRELEALLDYYPKWLEINKREEEDDNSAKIGKDGKLIKTKNGNKKSKIKSK